jgi:hypothetical protein
VAKYDVFFRYVSAGAGGAVVDMAAAGMMGAIYMVNRGAFPVWFNFTNVAPVAAFGDGKMLINVGDSFNLENIQIRYIALRGAGGASDIEFMVTPRAGPTGSGS